MAQAQVSSSVLLRHHRAHRKNTELETHCISVCKITATLLFIFCSLCAAFYSCESKATITQCSPLFSYLDYFLETWGDYLGGVETLNMHEITF